MSDATTDSFLKYIAYMTDLTPFINFSLAHTYRGVSFIKTQPIFDLRKYFMKYLRRIA